MNRVLVTFVGVASLLVIGACGSREHLRPSHGVSSRESFSRQQVNPQAGRSGKPVAGLDSQDAQTVAKTYRTGMAPKSDASAAASSRGVIIVPNAANPPGYGPASSLPTP